MVDGFISTTILSGLVFEAFKFGTAEYITYVRMALKDFVLSDEEHALIAKDLELSTEDDRSSKEAMTAYFEKAPNTKKIVNKYQQTNNHSGSVNIIQGGQHNTLNHSGSGDMTMGDKHEHHYPKVEPKKS